MQRKVYFITAILLSVIFALTCLSSCADTSGNLPSDTTASESTDTTAADTTAEEPKAPGIPDYAYEIPDEAEVEFKNPCNIYVSSDAAEGGDGSEAAPFGTLEAARDAVRALDRAGHDGINVFVSGTFFRTETLELSDPLDSGSEDCPIRWIGRDAVITGGVDIPLSEMSPVSGEAAGWFDEAVKDKILSVDLTGHGIPADSVAYAEFAPNDAYAGKMNGLYSGDTLLTLARYPNDRYISFSNVEELENGDYRVGYAEIHNRRISLWHDKDLAYVFGYFNVYWAADYTKIYDINEDDNKFSLKNNDHYPPKKGDGKFCWINIPEEIDMPGEYVITEDGMLYYYPLEGSESVRYPLAECRFFNVQANYIGFDGFTLSDTTNKAADFRGDHITVKNCTVTRTGDLAVSIKGDYNRFIGCEIFNTANGGVKVDGGDINTLTRANTLVADNYVHDFAVSKQTYAPAFSLNGCGIVLRNNEMAYANHEAVAFSGNYHVVEYNDIHDVCLYTDDAGAIYAGRTLSMYGNVFRYNYIHNIGSPDLVACGTYGIYWDDGLSGQTAYNNIFENAFGGLVNGGGSDNVIKDNIFINCTVDIAYDQRYYDQAVANYDGHNLRELVEDMLNSNPTYDETFPTVRKMIADRAQLDDEWFWANPARSLISGNVGFQNKEKIAAENGEPWRLTSKVKEMSTVENNTVTEYENADALPSVEDAVKASGFDIDFENIGIRK